MNIEAFIASKLAMPITHNVVATYADGSRRVHGTRSIGAAQTHIDFVLKPMLNRNLKDRMTGKVSRMISVVIEEA